MGSKTIRRLAASVLGVGENRIKMSPTETTRLNEALTREDVRGLIRDGVVYAEAKKGVSRARGRRKHEQKKKGRRRGVGSRKGGKYSKVSRKEIWMSKVRAQRRVLRELDADGKLKSESFRSVYLMIKGGAFKGKAQLESYLVTNKLMKK
ncbi:MAG: 50S ribosomal protein L19e [Candidatus Micrarchaeota archaeon]